MKKIGLCILFLSGSILFCAAQTNSNNSNFVSASEMKSKKPAASTVVKVDPSSETNVTGDQGKTQTQVRTVYLEYKVDPGNNTTGVENQEDKKVTLPIQAEGYTDPNYELNKQKSTETTQQLNSTPAPEKTVEEMIVDLQNKIKAIKDGEVTGCVATTKLSIYEAELELLLNNKQK